MKPWHILCCAKSPTKGDKTMPDSTKDDGCQQRQTRTRKTGSKLTMKDLETQINDLRSRLAEQRDSLPAAVRDHFNQLVADFNDPATRSDPQAISALADRFGGLQSQIDSLRSTVNDLGERVAEDHDTVVDLKQRVDDHDERLERLASLTRQGYGLDLAASMAGYNESEVRKILGVADDTELNGNELIGAIAKRLAQLSTSNAEAHQKITAVSDYAKTEIQAVNETLSEHAGAIVDLREKWRNRVEETPSLVPLGVGFIAGVVAFILANIFADWHWGVDFLIAAAAFTGTAGVLSFIDFISNKAEQPPKEEAHIKAPEDPKRETKERPKSTSTTTAVPTAAGSDNPPSGSSESPGARTSKTTTMVKETHREPANASS